MLLAAIAVVVIVSFIGALSWLSFTPAVAVNNISVAGNESVRTRAIQATLMGATARPLFGLFSRQSTLLYPSTELENILLFEFPKLHTASVTPKLTQNKVEVAITERETYALWCRNIEEKPDCYYIDADGFVFEKVGDVLPATEDTTVFRGGISETRYDPLRAYIAPEYFAGAKQFISDVASHGLAAKEFIFEGDDARVVLDAGWDIRIALDKDLGAAAFNLRAVLDDENVESRVDELVYIDMRFDERVYYKFQTSTDSSE